MVCSCLELFAVVVVGVTRAELVFLALPLLGILMLSLTTTLTYWPVFLARTFIFKSRKYPGLKPSKKTNKKTNKKPTKTNKKTNLKNIIKTPKKILKF